MVTSTPRARASSTSLSDSTLFSQLGWPIILWVGIEVHSSPWGARLFLQLERLHALPPIGLADHLVVRDLRRQPALLADANGLAHAIQHVRGFVARSEEHTS